MADWDEKPGEWYERPGESSWLETTDDVVRDVWQSTNGDPKAVRHALLTMGRHLRERVEARTVAAIVANLRSRATQEKRYGSGAAADALIDAADYVERGDWRKGAT